MDQPKNFLQILFDLKFEQFVTLKFISILYVIALAAAALGSVFFAFSGFANNFVSGLVTLILAPLIFLFYAIFSRIWLELIVVIFRIADNTRALVALKDGAPVETVETPRGSDPS